ncbi:PAS domain S-box protein [Desulfosediminicola ganghwensis]|uniref:PAS domain S-box protein n=1 Tax=Desulfosediminicola ganghwensis TaxID=2569540 RepID=UPI0010AC3E3E|nr:PAS domain S-box protein [Desulfosediminicola ganghwensis]
MLKDIEKQLEDNLPKIVGFWVQKHQTSASTNTPVISGNSANSAFLRLLTGSRKYTEKKTDRETIANILSEEISFFHDLTANMRDNGHDLGPILHSIATLRSTLEYFIKKCLAKDKHKLSAIQTMHRVTDCIETAISTEHRAENRLRELEQRLFDCTRSLKKSEKILDAIFQSVGEAILLLDPELTIIQANLKTSEFYGIAQEILTGGFRHVLIDGQGVHALSCVCGNPAKGEIHTIDCTSTHADGRKFPSQVTISSIHIDTQPFWLVIIRDITNQKEQEAKAVAQARHAEELNLTLRNVLKSIENEKREFQANLVSRISSSLQPTITRICREADEENHAHYSSLLQERIQSLTTDVMTKGAARGMDDDLLKLSKTELRICRFIKSGLTGKEICHEMNVSFETIQTHRKNIRKKLHLQGKGINLQTFLANRTW